MKCHDRISSLTRESLGPLWFALVPMHVSVRTDTLPVLARAPGAAYGVHRAWRNTRRCCA
ncbi:MAG TPA: hypothetical protein VKU41_19935 [Polyangiaceae bacterium]|nr:hypothetical protein [Polyangiaceae bacterium]